MRIYQLNSWTLRLQYSFVNSIKKHKPDIICLQETCSAKHDIIFGRIEYLKNKLPEYKYIYFSPLFNFNVLEFNAEFGNCVFSKLPFKQSNTIFTSLKYVNNFNWDEHDYNIRNFQHVLVETNGQKVNIINHHGYHVEQHKNGNEKTKKQINQILDYISKLDGFVVFTGDLNVAPHSHTIRLIEKQLRNLPAEAKLTTTRNFLTNKKEVCDYVFTDNEVKVKNFKMLDDIVSDHNALLVDLEI